MVDTTSKSGLLRRIGLALLLSVTALLAACSDEQAGTAAEGEITAVAEMADAAPEREQIPWDLSDIYESREAWDEARQWVLGQIPALQSYRGRLGESPNVLLEALLLQSQVTQEGYKVAVYGSMTSDQDQRISENQEMRQLGQEMFSQLGQATSWATPEILEIGAERIMEFVATDPQGYDRFRFTLQNILRNAPHTLSPEGEAIMAAADIATNQAFQTYSLLANSDIPWPTITLRSKSTGPTGLMIAASY